MELIQGLILIAIVHSLSAAAPGPDFILVCQQTLVHGRRAGYLCSIGIALGLSIHIIYSAFGLAALKGHSGSEGTLTRLKGYS
jgi:threonine/homoserine/homoserine lactone efflux protein